MREYCDNRWYGPFTQADFDKINEMWGKEMSIFEFFNIQYKTSD